MFKRAAKLDVPESEKRGVAKAFQRARAILAEAPSREPMLRHLRARGWESVDQAIQMAPRLAKRERKCPKCNGYGYLEWFREESRGRCYQCNGSGYV